VSVYNLTEVNDCDNVTGFTDSNKTPSLDTTVGQRYEGSGAISVQHTNTAGGDELDTAQSSGGGGAFSHNLSDATVYMMLKDNLVDTFANQGIMCALGDGTDLIGFQMGGNDAPGMPVPPFYNIYKFDASNLPSGSNTTFAGVEANLTLTAITRMGIGTVHLAKAVGNVDNCFMDRIAFIANDSYALTINGGSSGTPETMADVAGDDATNGWGLVANPLGKQYIFFGPTEWGEASASAAHYFTADGEQWFFVGDNQGGHAVGATHFPFRVIGNTTDIGSFVISNGVIVNTGTPTEFDCSDANVDTLEIDGYSMSGLASFEAPSSGGTSRFCTNTIFTLCGQVTHNGADMSGGSVLESTVAANGAALFYDETTDPDGEMDDMTFSQGTAAHHAITFGTNIPASITLRGQDFTGFSSSDDNDGSIFRFNDTSGNITLNLVGCTHDGSGFTVDDRAGSTVTVVIDPVTTLVHVEDDQGDDLVVDRVLLEAADASGDFPFFDTVTITRSGSTASVAHTAHGLVNGDVAVIRGAVEPEYNGPHTITNVTVNAYDFTVSGTPATPASPRRLAHAQDETSYDNSPTSEGAFSGGTGYSVNDEITLTGDVKITVDAVSAGVVTQFTVDASETPMFFTAGDTLTQQSSTGIGRGFTLTPDTDNIVIQSSGAILNGVTDSGGDISVSRTFSSDTPVKGVVRKSTASPRFKNFPLSGTIDSAAGLTINVRMVPDE
jgi:hypothetical protein